MSTMTLLNDDLTFYDNSPSLMIGCVGLIIIMS